MSVATYSEFIERKSQIGGMSGFAPLWMPDCLIDFQASLVDWSIRKGRGAIFADCGLGKTLMQLVWAENIVRHTNRPVLIMTPLAVSGQTVREADKFGIEAQVSRDGSVPAQITVTNYEQLHRFDASAFAGAVCDESSILKNFAGHYRKAITEFMRKMQYRLLCTATAAPNDFIELGTSSEAIGDLGHMDMLARFFKNDDNTVFLHGTKYGDFTQKGWRFKAHSERAFWRWVCSWARACRKPSDLGFDDSLFILPPLKMQQHEVKASRPAGGCLFDKGAATLEEQREEQRRTAPERCERVAELVNGHHSAVAWCHLKQESETLRGLISGSEEVSGSDSDERKEELFTAFQDGQLRVLITKPKIAGFGLNWQHCAHQTFFPSHSFEQWYQCMRRSWRFGQQNPVTVDLIATDGSANVLANLRRKAEAAERMFSRLVELMHQPSVIGRSVYGTEQVESPSWL